MQNLMRRYGKQILFTTLGALVGLGYNLIGCANGSCIVAANPFTSMIYMGIVGWLLSNVVVNSYE